MFQLPVGKGSYTLCPLDLFIHAGNVQCNGRSLYRYKGHRLGGSMREHKGHRLGGSTRASKIHKGCWQVGGRVNFGKTNIFQFFCLLWLR